MRTGFAVALLSLLAACGSESAPSSEKAEPAAGEVVSRESREGPVTATVSVTPSEPRLGDTMRLTLSVEAEPGVEIEMPIFGEALGRFTILGFTPREERRADGGLIASQEYRLQAAASGRLRVPPLRIVFFDRRPGAAGEAAAGERELLTEEIPIVVASVLAADDSGDLRAPRGELDPVMAPSWLRAHLWQVGGAAAIFAAAIALLWRRRRGRGALVTESPYAAARRRLAELEDRGVPAEDEVDDWYVELSAVVRRYLEGRFALRAPELTTEEFLRVAQRSDRLEPAHKELLAEFLAGCDRVKFAGYRPDASESRAALDTARRFVEDTRPVAVEAAAAGEAAA